jgi:hypothetical protein
LGHISFPVSCITLLGCLSGASGEGPLKQQKAIHERMLELAQGSDDSAMEERWLIDVALMNLRSLLEQREAA